MSDYIIRGMAADKQVRFFAANTKDLVEKARRIHNTSPIATAALGRLMTGTAMMGSMCKNDSDIVTVQIKGDGHQSSKCSRCDRACIVNPSCFFY